VPHPQYCPTPRELDDLELIVSGAAAPQQAFHQPNSPLTLALPGDVHNAAEEAGGVELVDPEGLPLATVSLPGWKVEPLSRAAYGPFRDLYLTPQQVHEQYAGRTVVPVTDALTLRQVDALRAHGPVVLVALVGAGTPELSPVALIRATRLAAASLPDAAVVAVPLASHGDPEADHALGLQVLQTYAGGGEVAALPDDEDGDYADDVAAVIERDQPAPDEQGLVLFFTGLSGSGKSTLARGLMDRILEQAQRSITSLDGDVVRRNLSTGLSFSREDRETNIRRIGWVAAEIARHGGLAVCSPIAPFDETRQQVRAMVDEAGGAFFLVHVATPVEECERRDRKGLYAKARRGEIPDFTGISSPYEAPDDADVRVDTTGRDLESCLDEIIDALAATGHLDLRAPEASSPVFEPVETPVDAGVEEGRSPVSKPDDLTRRTLDSISASESSDGDPRWSSSDERQPVDRAASEASGRRDRGASVETSGADREPIRVLFVCTANICRSPFMELTARHLAGNRPIEFRSAGTHGFPQHPMDEVMASTLAPRGVQGVDTFRSHAITADDIEWADLVLTAESAHRQFILDDHPAAFRKVLSLGQFVAAATQLDATGRELVAAVGAKRGTAASELDIDDPYRRGTEAAETAAVLIEGLVRDAVDRLALGGDQGTS